jgi:hypothetical protein
LLDHSIDVLIGQTSGDDPRPRFASAGYQLIGLDGDRDAIMRVEAPAHQLGGDVNPR